MSKMHIVWELYDSACVTPVALGAACATWGVKYRLVCGIQPLLPRLRSSKVSYWQTTASVMEQLSSLFQVGDLVLARLPAVIAVAVCPPLVEILYRASERQELGAVAQVHGSSSMCQHLGM